MVGRFAHETGVSISVTLLEDGAQLVRLEPPPDIVLLDIEMDEVDGMKAARLLRRAGSEAQIIFVTNMAQYAIKGYEVSALDFMVKPVRYPSFAFRFSRAVELALQRSRTRVALDTRDGFVRVDVASISYVEVRGHRLVYHTTSEGDLELWGTIKAAAAQLEPYGFMLCNACYLVNLDRVTRLEGEYVIVGDTPLKMSRSRRKPFLDALTRAMRG